MNSTTWKGYLSRTEASEYLQDLGLAVAPSTLAKLAVIGGGPPYVKFMSRARYEPRDLHEWAASRISPKRRSTSLPSKEIKDVSSDSRRRADQDAGGPIPARPTIQAGRRPAGTRAPAGPHALEDHGRDLARETITSAVVTRTPKT
jgi:hypothetical protein